MKKRASRESTEAEERPDDREQVRTVIYLTLEEIKPSLTPVYSYC